MKDLMELFEVVSDENYSEDGFNSKIMTEGEVFELAEEILEDYDEGNKDDLDLEGACEVLRRYKDYEVYSLRQSFPAAFE